MEGLRLGSTGISKTGRSGAPRFGILRRIGKHSWNMGGRCAAGIDGKGALEIDKGRSRSGGRRASRTGERGALGINEDRSREGGTTSRSGVGVLEEAF